MMKISLNFIDIQQMPFHANSSLLLCSDGLSDLVPSMELLRAADEHAGDPWTVVRVLVDKANDAGGKDNISVVYIEGESFASMARERISGPCSPEHNGAISVSGLSSIARGYVRFFMVFALGTLVGGSLSYFLVKATTTSRSHVRYIRVAPEGHPDAHSIREALSIAQVGDTIEVMPGTYREQIRLRDGVAIIGYVRQRAVIRPAAFGGETVVAIIAEKTKNARIVGLKIAGDEQEALDVGVRVTDADVDLTDIDVSGARIAAVEIGGSSDSTITSSSFHDNPGTGIVIAGRANPVIIFNGVTANGGGVRPGIDIRDQANPTVKQNVIVANDGGAIWCMEDPIGKALEENYFSVNGEPDPKEKIRVLAGTSFGRHRP